MDRLMELEQKAIDWIKMYEPEDGYYLAYSGGKDSDTIKILATVAGVKFEAVHNLTTVDAPETVQYVKSQPDVRIDYPHTSMWQLIVDKGIPPIRRKRYCCDYLKERTGEGRLVMTGVRRAESARRENISGAVNIIGKPKTTQKLADQLGADYRVNSQGGIVLNNDNDATRRLIERCYTKTKTMVNPIVHWADKDVWDYLHYYGCRSNPLYQCGHSRIGCIGCPLLSGDKMQAEFARYPIYRDNYIRAFDRMVQAHGDKWANRPDRWHSGQEVYDWWVRRDSNQMVMDWFEEQETRY